MQFEHFDTFLKSSTIEDKIESRLSFLLGLTISHSGDYERWLIKFHSLTLHRSTFIRNLAVNRHFFFNRFRKAKHKGFQKLVCMTFNSAGTIFICSCIIEDKCYVVSFFDQRYYGRDVVFHEICIRDDVEPLRKCIDHLQIPCDFHYNLHELWCHQDHKVFSDKLGWH